MAKARREFLGMAAGAAAAGIVRVAAGAEPSSEDDGNAETGAEEEKGEEVGATEDLMREHGVLDRVLLIYEEGLRPMAAKEEVGPEPFRRSAELVRRFVEDYHERLEEQFIFPVFARDEALAKLAAVLKRQHESGRAVTAEILRLSTGDSFAKRENRDRLTVLCRSFITVYRPHSAREDTVLFPALREVLPAKRIDELGEQFEAQEHKLFGEEGFQKTVEQVGEIERHLGVHDLEKFTPKL